MTVENIGNAEDFRGFQHGAGEQGETLGVIGIVSRGGTVKGIPVEVWGIFDKVEFDPTLAASAHDRGKPILVIEGDGDAANHGDGLGELGLAVAGQVNADLMAQSG